MGKKRDAGTLVEPELKVPSESCGVSLAIRVLSVVQSHQVGIRTGRLWN